MGEVSQAPARKALGGALAREIDTTHTHTHTHANTERSNCLQNTCDQSVQLFISRASRGSSAHGRDEIKGKPDTGLAQAIWGEGPCQADIGRAPGKTVACREGPRGSSVLVSVPSPAAGQDSDPSAQPHPPGRLVLEPRERVGEAGRAGVGERRVGAGRTLGDPDKLPPRPHEDRQGSELFDADCRMSAAASVPITGEIIQRAHPLPLSRRSLGTF